MKTLMYLKFTVSQYFVIFIDKLQPFPLNLILNPFSYDQLLCSYKCTKTYIGMSPPSHTLEKSKAKKGTVAKADTEKTAAVGRCFKGSEIFHRMNFLAQVRQALNRRRAFGDMAFNSPIENLNAIQYLSNFQLKTRIMIQLKPFFLHL